MLEKKGKVCKIREKVERCTHHARSPGFPGLRVRNSAVMMNDELDISPVPVCNFSGIPPKIFERLIASRCGDRACSNK